jgi:hypothetical protein
MLSQQSPRIKKVEPNHAGSFRASVRLWHMLQLIFYWPDYALKLAMGLLLRVSGSYMTKDTNR